MDVARSFRTVRHLTAEQWIFRLVCRGKFLAMGRFPRFALRLFENRAKAGPAPDPASPDLALLSAHIRQLQRAVHDRWCGEAALGRFTLLNQTIDFGGLDRIEWRRELGEKNNRLWRMNLAYMGYLVPLFERDARNALPVAQSILASMTAQNPWSCRGVFRDVWHPYSVSHRAINLLICLRLLYEQAPDLLPQANAISDQIRLDVAFVAGNLERDLQYNHLLKNYVCLAAFASAAPDASFASAILKGTRASIEQQFLRDGGQAERAPMYHVLSLIDLRVLRHSGALDSDTQALVETTIRASEASTAAMVHPDGEVALFNDSWLGEGPPAADVVSDLAVCPADQSRWTMADAGYVRLAQGDDSVVMDFGNCGPDDNPGHAHADFLSLELSVGGKRLLVDTGVPTYSEGAARDMSRSAASHNGPTCEGLEPIEFWGSFRVGRRGYAAILPIEGAMRFAAWHDGYKSKNIAAARAIEFIPGEGLLISDLWVGAGSHAAKARSRFTIAGRWRPSGLGVTADQSIVSFHAIKGTLGSFERAEHWLRFGERNEASRIVMNAAEFDGVQAASLWINWSDRKDMPLSKEVDLRKSLTDALLSLPQVSRLL